MCLDRTIIINALLFTRQWVGWVGSLRRLLPAAKKAIRLGTLLALGKDMFDLAKSLDIDALFSFIFSW